MLTLRLHPLRRNAPLTCGKVDLFPQRTAHLAAPARRQHEELERQHRRGIRTRAAHLLDGLGDLPIRERGEMAHLNPVLGQRRADGLPGRVVLPVTLRHRPTHHRRDPVPNPAGGHPLLVPDGKQHRHHVRRGDAVHRPPSELRNRIVSEGRPPQILLPAAVLPSGPVYRDHLLQRLLEGGDGPLAPGHQFPAPTRREVQGALLAGLCEADVGPRAEPEVALAAVQTDALRPGLGQVASGRMLDEE